MPGERILIEFADDIDGSEELVTTAGRVAFWFSTSYMDRPPGVGNGAAIVWNAHRWFVHWTKARAVSVRCAEHLTGEQLRALAPTTTPAPVGAEEGK